MKKLFMKIMAFCLITAMVLSFSGCMIAQNRPLDFDGGLANQSATQELPDSSDLVKTNVSITAGEERTETPMTIDEAANKVKRSSVALTIVTSSGTSYGSGVIVDISDSVSDMSKTLYIITCHHMVENLGSIIVYVPDKDFRYGEDDDYTFTGKLGGTKESNKNNAVTLVGGDKTSDIAVLKIDISKSSLTIDDFYKAKIIDDKYSVNYGEQVFAIGNPSGICPGTLSEGRIAYLYRKTSVNSIGSMILNQIDVSTNHGSSGGGLYNLYGELIGITNAGDDEYTNLNFAIPEKIPTTDGEIDNGFINIATQLIATASQTDFENYGYISGRREKMGMTISTITTSDPSYVQVTDVTKGSRAEEQGIAAGDIINSLIVYKSTDLVNGTTQNITSVDDFDKVIKSLDLGDYVVINYTRKVNTWRGTYTTSNSARFRIAQYYFCDTGVYPS